MKKNLFLVITVLGLLLGAVSNNNLQAEPRFAILSSRAPAPSAPALSAFYQKGMQYARFHSQVALGQFPAFSKTKATGDEMHYDVLEWLDVALHANGVDGRRESFWVIVFDDDGVTKHHPNKFQFAIRSSDSDAVINFSGNMATNVATGQELSWSPTTFVGWDYGAEGVTNVYTSGVLKAVDVFVTPLRVWLSYNDATSLATIESFVLINDPWRITCQIQETEGGASNNLEVSTAPVMLMSTVNTGTNILPVVNLIGQPSSLASYTVFWSDNFEVPKNTWPVLNGNVGDGWFQAFINTGPKYFWAWRGNPPAQGRATPSGKILAGFSQTDD